jgi:hypothetical protein
MQQTRKPENVALSIHANIDTEFFIICDNLSYPRGELTPWGKSPLFDPLFC